MDMVSVPKESLQRFVDSVRSCMESVAYYRREALRANFSAGSDFGAVQHDLGWLEKRLVATLLGDSTSDESLCEVARKLPDFRAKPR